jgi:SAM-dependent methyltransferase
VGRGRRVLELACGDGRVMLPLLLRGNDVTGVDDSQPMLAILEEKLAKLPRLADRWTLTWQSMTEPVAQGPFDWVVVAAGTMTLLSEDDRRRVYASVREALTADGRFLLSSWGFAADDKPPTSTRLLNLEQLGIVATFHEELGAERTHRDLYVVPTVVDGRPVTGTVLHSRTAVLPTDELVAELVREGFEVLERIDLPQDDRMAQLLVTRVDQ